MLTLWLLARVWRHRARLLRTVRRPAPRVLAPGEYAVRPGTWRMAPHAPQCPELWAGMVHVSRTGSEHVVMYIP